VGERVPGLLAGQEGPGAWGGAPQAMGARGSGVAREPARPRPGRGTAGRGRAGSGVAPGRL